MSQSLVMPRRACIVLGCLSLVVSACGGSEPTGSSRLSSRFFLAQELTENGIPRVPVGSSVPNLVFNEGTGVAAGAGCHTRQGGYEIVDDVLVLSDAFVLADASFGADDCNELLREQEDWYFEFLQSSPSIAIEGDSKVLEGEDIRIEYLDQRVAVSELDLWGPTWTIDTVVAGGLTSQAQQSVPATLTFDRENDVVVSTGCNTGTAVHAVTSQGLLVFYSYSVTEEACPDPPSAELEAAVLDVLSAMAPVQWEITVDRLSLWTGDVRLELVGSTG
jgi:heat shock protein HslJ